MKEEVIGRRYAKALIQLGKEQDTWKQVGQDLEEFVSVFEQDEFLSKILCDPVHDRLKRKAILKGVLKKMGTGEVCFNFLCLLVDKERIRFLPVIYNIYRKLEDDLAGRMRASVTTAQKLGDNQKEAVRKALEDRFNKQIFLEEIEDREILGGIVCKVDGMVFDGSVRTQLEILGENIRGE